MCRFRYWVGCFDAYSSSHKSSNGWRCGLDGWFSQRCGCHAYPGRNCGGGRRRRPWIQWLGRNHRIDQNGIASRPRYQDQHCHYHHSDVMSCSNHSHLGSLPTKSNSGGGSLVRVFASTLMSIST